MITFKRIYSENSSYNNTIWLQLISKKIFHEQITISLIFYFQVY